MLTQPRANLKDAIHDAYSYAPCGICYVQGRGWSVYDLTKGCSPHTADFVYIKSGTLPLPLNDEAQAAIDSLICSAEI